MGLAKSLGNLSASCKSMGYSRDSYYRFQELYEIGGVVDAISRNKPIIANRVDTLFVETAIVDIAVE